MMITFEISFILCYMQNFLGWYRHVQWPANSWKRDALQHVQYPIESHYYHVRNCEHCLFARTSNVVMCLNRTKGYFIDFAVLEIINESGRRRIVDPADLTSIELFQLDLNEAQSCTE